MIDNQNRSESEYDAQQSRLNALERFVLSEIIAGAAVEYPDLGAAVFFRKAGNDDGRLTEDQLIAFMSRLEHRDPALVAHLLEDLQKPTER